MQRDLVLLRMVLYLNVLDWATTLYGVEKGLMAEANPVMLPWVAAGAWWTTLFIKLGLIVSVMAWRSLHNRDFPLVRISIYIMLTFYSFIVVRSILALGAGIVII